MGRRVMRENAGEIERSPVALDQSFNTRRILGRVEKLHSSHRTGRAMVKTKMANKAEKNVPKIKEI